MARITIIPLLKSAKEWASLQSYDLLSETLFTLIYLVFFCKIWKVPKTRMRHINPALG